MMNGKSRRLVPVRDSLSPPESDVDRKMVSMDEISEETAMDLKNPKNFISL